MYKLTDDLAIVQTVDFFTPIVDNPYDFGRIAAANALSDIYAMGGKPLTAMNLVCFPSKTMDISILREILRGGMDKLSEAQTTLVGGHSVDDPELKFGLSVTGTIHPEQVITNTGAKLGDVLILTKPLGTGIINTAIKANIASAKQISTVTEQMATLNKNAADLMLQHEVHACTDVTGFGLLGHACEMIQDTSIGIQISASAVPLVKGVIDFANGGLIPGGAYRNRDFRASMVEFSPDVPDWSPVVLFDPQTSGGLLIALPKKDGSDLMNKLLRVNVRAAIIGEVVDSPANRIIVEH